MKIEVDKKSISLELEKYFKKGKIWSTILRIEDNRLHFWKETAEGDYCGLKTNGDDLILHLDDLISNLIPEEEATILTTIKT